CFCDKNDGTPQPAGKRLRARRVARGPLLVAARGFERIWVIALIFFPLCFACDTGQGVSGNGKARSFFLRRTVYTGCSQSPGGMREPMNTGSESRPIVRVSRLVKRYGGKPVVSGVSFEVAEGEVFGLLGPNGAGKT